MTQIISEEQVTAILEEIKRAVPQEKKTQEKSAKWLLWIYYVGAYGTFLAALVLAISFKFYQAPYGDYSISMRYVGLGLLGVCKVVCGIVQRKDCFMQDDFVEIRVVDGFFSGPSIDAEPRGLGMDFASGIRVYSVPAGVVEVAHQGPAHLIDLHGDLSRMRMAIDSDVSHKYKPPAFSAGFIPAGCELRLDNLNITPPTLIFIEPDTLNRFCEQEVKMPFLYWQHDERIAKKHQWLTTAVSNPLTDPLAIETTALEIMEHTVGRLNNRKGRFSTQVRHRRGTLRAIDYLETHLGEISEISQLASAATMAPFHFLRAFQAETGETPHQYLIRRRLEEAQHSLAYSREPLADLAVRLGFCNQAHLTDVMRKKTGLTPGQIRQTRDRTVSA